MKLLFTFRGYIILSQKFATQSDKYIYIYKYDPIYIYSESVSTRA